MLFPPLLVILAQYVASSTAQRMQQSQLDFEPCAGPWQWMCKDGECIAQYDVCDGIAQCRDGSDEWNCGDAHSLHDKLQKPAPKTGSTVTSTTTTTAAPTLLIVTKHQVHFVSSSPIPVQAYVYALVGALLLVIFVVFCRHRLRAKPSYSRPLPSVRNRRGRLRGGLTGAGGDNDSDDEDDILISSMYS